MAVEHCREITGVNSSYSLELRNLFPTTESAKAK